MNVAEASGLGRRYGRTRALRECTLQIPAALDAIAFVERTRRSTPARAPPSPPG